MKLDKRLGKLGVKVRKELKNNKYVIGATTLCLAIYGCSSHNGMFDSMRTKEAAWLQGNPTNTVRTVAAVEEEWKDNVTYSLMMDGYNPKVRREVTFEDGSQTTLNYRTLAWQPIMRWKNGDMFNPQPGEQYEVTSRNQIVRKIQ